MDSLFPLLKSFAAVTKESIDSSAIPPGTHAQGGFYSTYPEAGVQGVGGYFILRGNIKLLSHRLYQFIPLPPVYDTVPIERYATHHLL